MAWLDQFEVDDLVETEWLDVPGLPRWNHSIDGGATGRYEIGRVLDVQVAFNRVLVQFVSTTWYFTDPGDEQRDGYLRCCSTVVAVHTERIGIPNPGQYIPESILDAAIARGESAVRRRLREWPFGKDLKYKISRGKIEWYFVDC